MKRTLKLLAKLYPATWRARYGNELDALIDDGTMRFTDALDVLRGGLRMQFTSSSFIRIVLPCALIGSLAGLAISIKRPALYQSQTLIQVDTNDPGPIDQELTGLVEQAFGKSQLASIIEKENLYRAEGLRIPANDTIDLMKKHIYLRPLKTKSGQTASAFIVQFDYPDPKAAQKVDRDLASLLLDTKLKTDKTVDFLKEELGVVRDPGTRKSIQFGLNQLEAAGRSLNGTLAVLSAANLPDRPMGPGRTAFAAAGLLAGFLGGLVLAAIFGARSPSFIAKG